MMMVVKNSKTKTFIYLFWKEFKMKTCYLIQKNKFEILIEYGIKSKHLFKFDSKSRGGKLMNNS